ncbi:hypothetical protein CGZ80_04365 [Rhodopirellula sp. MGV]|nr:hypothetical protein CGZ80_04365 [Rhodopirellula sp. MGV]PNY37160.1 hypothetical protein C2E31_09220 [Rhodopirellula baltica]
MSADGMASYQTVHGLSFPTTIAVLKSQYQERRKQRKKNAQQTKSTNDNARLRLKQSAEFSTTA